MPSTARDMLVASPDRWDEACFCVPAVRALIAAGIGTGVICHDRQTQFWNSIPGLQVLPFPEKAKPKAAAAAIGSGWKAALLWQPGFAADAAGAAGIPQLLGPDHPKLAKHLTQTLKTRPQPLDHRTRFYLSAVEDLGINTRRPEFFAPADTRPRHSGDPAPAVLLSPDSDFGPSHQWPAENWRQLADRLTDSDITFRAAILNRRQSAAAQLLANRPDAGEPLDLSNPGDSLPELAAFPVTVTADSSLPHLASHAGSTCVTLFGPNDPAWKRPLGTRHISVRQHVECAPCLLPKCPMDLRCQNELDLTKVWDAVTDAINR